MAAGSDLQQLLEYLRDARGFDFTGYKPSSLERRLRKRMEVVGVDGYDAYRDHLEVRQDEFQELFNTILINVTGFFRDPDAWKVIAEQIVPAILKGKPPEAPIRVWSAGCASGEEAYTVAMILAEALGAEAFQQRVKIYGTDVDDHALEQARLAHFDAARLEDMPDELRDRYFEPVGTRWCFRKDLRRSMIFGRNNLVQDAPISRVDLLVCRNTLMYFNSESQGHILRRLHFALQPTGFLFLGKSEMLLTRREMFEPVDLKRRIFTKVVQQGDRRSRAVLPLSDVAAGHGGAGSLGARAFDAGPIAQIVVSRDRTLMVANAAARSLLGLGFSDVGRPLQDLAVSYRPAELRGRIDTVFRERQPIVMDPVLHRHEGTERTLEIRLTPLLADEVVDAVSVAFVDVTARRAAEQEVERARRELSTAYEELQSTVEELETTNEELQSTNEELETTNEELQSTNEELETMNEELSSSNEELETMNDEMRMRTLELREGYAVMEAVLRSKGVGVVVVDREQRVRMWSRDSEDLWGLREEEVIGTPLADLDIGLPVRAFEGDLRDAFADGAGTRSLELPAHDRRGREFACQVTLVPLSIDDATPSGVIVLAQRT